MTPPLELIPGRTLHKLLTHISMADRTYPQLIEFLRIPQPMSVTQRKRLNRKLAILRDMGLVFQDERRRFATTEAGDLLAATLGAVHGTGQPNARVFATKEAHP